MSRRELTKRKLLDALEEQINATGMAGVGVNAVAKRAGVSKELIYRYFDGMSGLLLAWMQEQDFWTARGDLLKDEECGHGTPASLILSMLHDQIEALAESESLREIRRWELIELNEVTAQLAQRREKAARAFIDRVDGLTEKLDVPATVSIMLAGVLYMMLRSKTESHFLGVSLRTNEGWRRLYGALEQMIQRGFPEELKTRALADLERINSSERKSGGER